MLATRLRVRPCSARSGPRSVGRATVSVLSSEAICIRGLISWASSPLGPLTVTRPGPIETVTPSGTGIGFLPIRLMLGSPHVGDDLAADALRARLVAGHHAARGRDDRRAHAALDARHLAATDVAPAPGPRDPAQAADHGPAVLGVLELDPDHLADGRGLDLEAGDVALLGEDPGDVLLQPRSRDLDLGMIGGERVSKARQVIGDWIGEHQNQS